MILIINLGKKIQKLIWTWLQITDLTDSLLNINNFSFKNWLQLIFSLQKPFIGILLIETAFF